LNGWFFASSHAWAAVIILVNKFDAGPLEGAPDDLERAAVGAGGAGLHLVDGHNPDCRNLGKALLAPAQEAARGSALLRRDHLNGIIESM
jgi:hypothetical protein